MKRALAHLTSGIGLRLGLLWLTGLALSLVAPPATAGDDLHTSVATGAIEVSRITQSGECPDADGGLTELDWPYGLASVSFDHITRTAALDVVAPCWSGSVLLEGCSVDPSSAIRCHWEQRVWVPDPRYPNGGYWFTCAARDLFLTGGVTVYLDYVGFDACGSSFERVWARGGMVRAEAFVPLSSVPDA